MANPLRPINENPTHRQVRRFILFLTLIGAPLLTMAQSLTHEMQVELRPDSGVIVVEDTISIAKPVDQFEFVLNTGLEIDASNASITKLTESADGLRAAYRAVPETPTTQLVLRYQGVPLFGKRRQMGGMPEGEVSEKGVYLDSNSAWHARFNRPITGLDLSVVLPEGWQSVSVGKRAVAGKTQRWRTSQPHDNLYLLAARYERHALQHKETELSVWLLDDDPALAERYLEVMGGYIDHYTKLIGPYPFAKFAVVENRWQTGYGMPSFTLLGSRVMRLPFIPYTSLPHEILHNWWGNGVWIDYARGNWSEGLTAYLADHWMQERRGTGDRYRLKALQRYSNFAADDADTPLLEFVSRHNDASQSVGYSKSLMLFHMLRRELGDSAFTEGLRKLWRDKQFQRVGFSEVVRLLASSDPDLMARAVNWLEREGAVRLTLDAASVTAGADGYRLDLTLRQAPPVFDVEVPVSVMLEGETEARVRRVRLAAEQQTLSLVFPSMPQRVDIDPAFDVLRLLDPSEQPPALNRLFGSGAWVVTPSDASDAEQAAWQALISQWQRRYPKLRQVADHEAGDLPDNSDRLVLGWQNRLRQTATAALRRQDQQLTDRAALINGTAHAAATNSVVLVNSDPTGVTTGFIASPTPEGIAMLARKLPHYGSYGQLVFDATAERNLFKQALTSEHSRLTHQFGDRLVSLNLPPQPVLGQAPSN